MTLESDKDVVILAVNPLDEVLVLLLESIIPVALTTVVFFVVSIGAAIVEVLLLLDPTDEVLKILLESVVVVELATVAFVWVSILGAATVVMFTVDYEIVVLTELTVATVVFKIVALASVDGDTIVAEVVIGRLALMIKATVRLVGLS